MKSDCAFYLNQVSDLPNIIRTFRLFIQASTMLNIIAPHIQSLDWYIVRCGTSINYRWK